MNTQLEKNAHNLLVRAVNQIESQIIAPILQDVIKEYEAAGHTYTLADYERLRTAAGNRTPHAWRSLANDIYATLETKHRI